MTKYTFTEKKDTRSGYGAGLLEAAKRNPNVVGLTADLTGSVKMDAFAKAFPERFVQVGIAEANMIGIAAGMTIGGKIPFASTFANFATSRVYDQIRQSVAYSTKNVKIAATHAGLTVGEDGATHQVLEDIGMMKMLPGMTVVVPCDYNQAYLATLAAAEHYGPMYLRYGRPTVPNFTSLDEKFEIGKGILLQEGKDVTIIATGHLVWTALQAAEQLLEKDISAEVINIHTIKPLDTQLILASALKTGCVVTVEEHNIIGGLGDSVAHLLSRTVPTPIEMLGVNDVFGESGTPQQLLDKHHLNEEGIIASVQTVLNRK
ncbi:MAG: transketolase family protein [Bacteroidales bacterium]|jgi:transketolase|nr:transketolase family protein [Bacteroidales bacterium]